MCRIRFRKTRGQGQRSSWQRGRPGPANFLSEWPGGLSPSRGWSQGRRCREWLAFLWLGPHRTRGTAGAGRRSCEARALSAGTRHPLSDPRREPGQGSPSRHHRCRSFRTNQPDLTFQMRRQAQAGPGPPGSRGRVPPRPELSLRPACVPGRPGVAEPGTWGHAGLGVRSPWKGGGTSPPDQNIRLSGGQWGAGGCGGALACLWAPLSSPGGLQLIPPTEGTSCPGPVPRRARPWT